ncbi:[NiFe]-hydrogenase assembly chaperone HybE [Thiohalorhabdus sp. Cl-TMA]|uniref:[NiFe]-hydrogenase assembly chaperone HybE n=1 Tax=Thiohalorhabdus methylotrophus TaxID=3242694 RepID=UPI00359FD518
MSELERHYAAVARGRMADFPLANGALAVEAVGFRPWEGAWLGALVTPWALNLVRLPPVPTGGSRSGRKTEYRFPAGAFEFVEAADEGFGAYAMCSLFSPVLEFADQQAARTTAEAAVSEVLDADREAPEAGQDAAKRTMSRRGFLRGGGAGAS